jgi:hypothetical protein
VADEGDGDGGEGQEVALPMAAGTPVPGVSPKPRASSALLSGSGPSRNRPDGRGTGTVPTRTGSAGPDATAAARRQRAHRREAPLHAFELFDQRLITIGLETATLTITDPGDIEYYASLFNVLQETAQFGTQAANLLEEIASSYERTP